MVTHQHWFCQIHFETFTYNANLKHAASGRFCTSQTLPRRRRDVLLWIQRLLPHATTPGLCWRSSPSPTCTKQPNQPTLEQSSCLRSASRSARSGRSTQASAPTVAAAEPAALQTADKAKCTVLAQRLAPRLRMNTWGWPKAVLFHDFSGLPQVLWEQGVPQLYHLNETPRATHFFNF